MVLSHHSILKTKQKQTQFSISFIFIKERCMKREKSHKTRGDIEREIFFYKFLGKVAALYIVFMTGPFDIYPSFYR